MVEMSGSKMINLADVQGESTMEWVMRGWNQLTQPEVYRKVLPVVAFVVMISIYMMQSKVYREASVNDEIITTASVAPEMKRIKAMTWNIAAINNNPFEYWITNKDPSYNRIMANVSTFIDFPGAFDVPVGTIFSDQMYNQLEESMIAANWTGIAATRKLWDADYKHRKIISQFLKDAELGKKRLVSMPDRVTNTINTATEGVVMRPTVVNCYDKGDLSTLDKWWALWRVFIFRKEVTIKKLGVNTNVKVRDMFSKIKKSKYPSITVEEEEISIPLQTLCAAIFDAILVNMMNIIDSDTWQPLREDMCNKLNRKKTERIAQILQTAYASSDIHFLQEVASSFSDSLKSKPIANLFDIFYPSSMDSDRDQNSFILLKKGKFKDVTEVTSSVLKKLDTRTPVPIANGDLFVLTALDVKDNARYILGSFHGDTNGLATIPIVSAVHDFAMTKPNYKLLFGMDANTYAHPDSDQQGVVQFAEFYTSKSLNSCYGPTPNPLNFTTFHARTHLQPQLNKAVRFDEKDKKGDKNPKDFILFFDNDFSVVTTMKDNTGEHKYIDNMVFPTLSFPSDHGITSTILIEKSEKSNRIKAEKVAKGKDKKDVKKVKKHSADNSTTDSIVSSNHSSVATVKTTVKEVTLIESGTRDTEVKETKTSEITKQSKEEKVEEEPTGKPVKKIKTGTVVVDRDAGAAVEEAVPEKAAINAEVKAAVKPAVIVPAVAPMKVTVAVGDEGEETKEGTEGKEAEGEEEEETDAADEKTVVTITVKKPISGISSSTPNINANIPHNRRNRRRR